jgi:2-methylcitrate dehydratase
VDSTTRRLVDYAAGYSKDDLTDAAFTSTVNHVVDSIAVGIAGTTAESSRLAARLAATMKGEPGATVIGLGPGIAPDMAAFANAVMVRTYDWNDGMQAQSGGHPSDMIPALLAAGEITHSSGLDVLIAAALAYELLGGLGVSVARGHFDQGLFMGAAVALAGGRLLGLDREQLGHAASLALTTALPLGVHRWGALSMTKGASTAFAVRNGLFSALLAREGFTSAPEPVEGYFGLAAALGEFEPRLPVLPGGPSVMEMSHQKPVPAESQVLGLLGLVPAVRAWTPVDEIESIDVVMSKRAARHVADAAKFDPQNRETADHSLPFMLASALLDGDISLDSYRTERFNDPAIRGLMAKMTVTGSEEFTKIRAAQEGVMRAHPVRVTFRTRSGQVMSEDLRYHKGHYRDPMTKADLDAKFDKACRGVVGPAQRDRIREAWWNVADAPDIAEPVALLARFEAPGPGE